MWARLEFSLRHPSLDLRRGSGAPGPGFLAAAGRAPAVDGGLPAIPFPERGWRIAARRRLGAGLDRLDQERLGALSAPARAIPPSELIDDGVEVFGVIMRSLESADRGAQRP